ncbi:MAG TPA: GDP-mannose 4,6-dehydratase [Verrucomicrobiae bacterium]|nr:GDP-mannose 4,6-dehydratase [Verrucomicrobiae bacterium]
MKGVLITGRAGFIVAHLAEVLVKKSKEVFVINDLSTSSVDNTAALRESPLFHCTKASIRNSHDLEQPIRQVDFVSDLAAAVGVELVIKSPVYTIEDNVRGTEKVLARR